MKCVRHHPLRLRQFAVSDSSLRFASHLRPWRNSIQNDGTFLKSPKLRMRRDQPRRTVACLNPDRENARVEPIRRDELALDAILPPKLCLLLADDLTRRAVLAQGARE